MDRNLYFEYVDDIFHESYADSIFHEASPPKKGLAKLKWKENYYLLNNLLKPHISSVMRKPSVHEAIEDFVIEFIDNNSEALLAQGPIKSFVFAAKQLAPMYEMFNLSHDVLVQMFDKMMEESFTGKNSMDAITNAPHKLMITGMIIDCLVNDNEESLSYCGYLYAFADYPLVFKKVFTQGVHRPDIMKYTIENLSGQFLIKKMDNVLQLIHHTIMKCIQSHKEDLIRGEDYEWVRFINRARHSLFTAMNKIRWEYKKNYDNNASQHVQGAILDDGNLASPEGISAQVSSITDSTYNKIISGGVNKALVKAIHEGKGIDKDNLESFLNLIHSSKNNKISEFVENVVTIYLRKNPQNNSIGTKHFVNFGLDLFKSISNSRDKLYIAIQAILTYWMTNIIDIESKYPRVQTHIAYKKSIFEYMIWIMNHYN